MTKIRLLQSLLCGILLGLSHLSPWWISPAALIALPILLIISDEIPHQRRSIFWFLWFFGLGYFSTALYWTSVALTVDIAQFYWLLPFAFLGLPALLSLFFACFSLVLPWTRYQGLPKALCFILVWMAAEIARGYLFTGFPWPLLGYLWSAVETVSQLAYFTTVFGLSLLTCGLSSVPYLLYKNISKTSVLFAVCLACILALISIWGGIHIHNTKSTPFPPLRIVQPHIPQALKWDPRHVRQSFEKIVRLTQEPGLENVSLILWPEAALTYEITPGLSEYLAAIIPKGAYLITGAMRQDRQSRKAFNSLYVLNDQGLVIETYDKSHLVPFGEYIPFKAEIESLFPGMLHNISGGAMDSTPGPGIRTIQLQNLPPFSPLICYEVIFPKQVVAFGMIQPKWLLNLTNDAWYGNTAGPYQHLEIARFRAIEERLPLIRVANNGISAVIDANGRIQKKLGYNKTGIIDS